MISAENLLAVERNFYIEIKHLASKNIVYFKGWLDQFKDSFKVGWKSEDIYGRMDPIRTYGSTTRNITLAFRAVAASEDEAISNLAKIEMLVAMMYPTFNKKKGGNIQSGPALQIKFANLLINPPDEGDSAQVRQKLSSEIGGPPPGPGLYCTCDGFEYDPKGTEEEGYFMANGALYPKSTKISLKLTILHDKELGWYSSQKGTGTIGGPGNARWRGSKRFPYGLGGLGQEVAGVANKGSNNTVMSVKQSRIAAITGQIPDGAGFGELPDWTSGLR